MSWSGWYRKESITPAFIVRLSEEVEGSCELFISVFLTFILTAQCRYWQTFAIKGQMLNLLSLWAFMVSVATTQLFHCSVKFAIGDTYTSIWIPLNLFIRTIGLLEIVCWPLAQRMLCLLFLPSSLWRWLSN